MERKTTAIRTHRHRDDDDRGDGEASQLRKQNWAKQVDTSHRSVDRGETE